MSNKKYMCIYHHNCTDGFGGAWVIRKALGEANVEFVSASYGDVPPLVKGYDVILVDFSYTRDVMIHLSQTANSILVLDHHESAKMELEGLAHDPECRCRCEVVFDMGRSGVRLAWDYYFGDYPEIPPLIAHIEDRDLWKFSLDNTRQIMASVFSFPYDFEVWDKLIEGTELSELLMEGKAIQRKHHKDVLELIEASEHKLVIAGHTIPATNCPYFMGSEVCEELLRKHEDAPFAAYYYRINPTRIKFGLRSTFKADEKKGIDRGRLNVRAIAQQYPGGGGHADSSGFSVLIEDFHKLETVQQETGDDRQEN